MHFRGPVLQFFTFTVFSFYIYILTIIFLLHFLKIVGNCRLNGNEQNEYSQKNFQCKMHTIALNAFN